MGMCKFKFYYHITHDMEMCRWLFQGFTEILKMAATDQL